MEVERNGSVPTYELFCKSGLFLVCNEAEVQSENKGSVAMWRPIKVLLLWEVPTKLLEQLH